MIATTDVIAGVHSEGVVGVGENDPLHWYIVHELSCRAHQVTRIEGTDLSETVRDIHRAYVQGEIGHWSVAVKREYPTKNHPASTNIMSAHINRGIWTRCRLK